jgi:soluble lytic murein transglycosylase
MIRRVVVGLAAVGLVAGAGYGYLQHAQPDWWVRLRHPLAYRSEVVGNARIYHLDPALVAAVIYEESRFRPDTRSSAGAIGLMQLLPSTARGIAVHTGGKHFRIPQDLYVPDLNIRYGCWYLSHLRHKYAGHPGAVDLALAAYNAGQANVDDWIAHTPAGHTVHLRFAATREYVAAVRSAERLYRRVYDLR